MPTYPLGPVNMVGQSMTLPTGSQSMSMGGMGVRAQGMDGRKKSSGPGNWLGSSGTPTAEWALDGVVDTQGSLLVAGQRNATGQALAAKYSAKGERQWSVEIVGSSQGATLGYNPASGPAIAVDAANNSYLVTGNGSTTVDTLKISPSGQVIWARAYTAGTNTFPRSVAVGASGSVYILARTDGGGYGGSTVLVVKYSPGGVFQWSRNVDLQVGYGLTLDASENVYVTFQFAGVIKINSAGTLQWASQNASGTSPNYLRTIAVSSTGETYAVGDYGGTAQGAGIWALDASGVVRWTAGFSKFGGAWFDVLLSGSSLYCIGATSLAGAGADDILLAEYDTSGALKWQRTVGNSGNDYGYALAEADNNTLAIYGSTAIGAGSSDICIGRVSKSGPPAGNVGPFSVSASNIAVHVISSTNSIVSPATQTLGSDAASSLTATPVVLTTNVYPF